MSLSDIQQNLTGGPNGGMHITDVTNASRTLLMNLDTLEWDPVSIFELKITLIKIKYLTF